MKTHQLAKALTQLAAALRSLPDVEFETFLSDIRSVSSRARTSDSNADEIAVNVGTLAALSAIGKSRWKELIDQWHLPIEVPRKDSARNIMGEVMRYLENNPDEIRRIQQGAIKGSRASPALMRALSILMAPNNSEEP